MCKMKIKEAINDVLYYLGISLVVVVDVDGNVLSESNDGVQGGLERCVLGPRTSSITSSHLTCVYSHSRNCFSSGIGSLGFSHDLTR